MPIDTNDPTVYENINPFTPGFGQVPPYMAGREDAVNEIKRALNSPIHLPELTSLFVGARGTGKTALLSFLGGCAEASGWVSVSVSAIPGMLEDIYEQAKYKAAHLLKEEGGKRLKSLSIGGVAAEWEESEQQTGNWRTRMSLLLDELGSQDIGLMIEVDEIDPTLDETTRLASVYQHFISEGRKVSLMVAGLPSKVSSLLSSDSVSFLRRAQLYKLGRIGDEEISAAFRSTVAGAGYTLQEGAAEVATEAIEGFPYMLQLIGYKAWQNSAGSRIILVKDVVEGIELARADLRDKVLATTFRELSEGDRKFLFAMLDDEDGSTLADISGRLGVKSNYSTKYKARLIEAGVIGEDIMGRLVFELPMFRDYLKSIKSF